MLENPERLQRLMAASHSAPHSSDQPVALLTFRDSAKMESAVLRLTQPREGEAASSTLPEVRAHASCCHVGFEINEIIGHLLYQKGNSKQNS